MFEMIRVALMALQTIWETEDSHITDEPGRYPTEWGPTALLLKVWEGKIGNM